MASTQVEPETPPPSQADRAGRQFGTVFYVSVGFAVAFVLAGVLFTSPFGDILGAVVSRLIATLGWLYLLAATLVLAFVVFIALSRFGKIRLGGPDEKPEFGRFSWFAMLFQAGMGIGLVFWAVSEPVIHYSDPPFGQAPPGTPEAANLALEYAFFHWTLHPWAIYAVVGLAVAYFSYRRGVKSLRISTVFRPLLGDRVDGRVGQAIDVLAVLATLFGIAVSLGLGTLQIEAGLGEVFGVSTGIALQLLIIVVTAAAYMLSASTPVERGVRWLSNASMVMAAAMLAFFLVVGPTGLQFNAFTQDVGGYLSGLVPMSLRTGAFDPDPWLGEWTIFFWATWIAWAPYVGVFIARISRGRTVREFLLGVLIAPSVFSMVWFAVLGGTAIDLDGRLGGAISSAASSDEALGLFTFLAENPLPIVTSVLAIALVWIFFVAGADAGTIVLGSMSAGGTRDPKRLIKLIWGAIMGAVAAVLLVAGGLNSLQDGAILLATPFTVILVAICWALYRALAEDDRAQARRPAGAAPARGAPAAGGE
jgi:glycine betaine transporter